MRGHTEVVPAQAPNAASLDLVLLALLFSSANNDQVLPINTQTDHRRQLTLLADS